MTQDYGLWPLVVINTAVFTVFAFSLQWPTLPTLAMFPVLLVVYRRLVRDEEREAAGEFGPRWEAYAARVPAFVPRRPHDGDDRAPGAGPAARTHGQRPPRPHPGA